MAYAHCVLERLGIIDGLDSLVVRSAFLDGHESFQIHFLPHLLHSSDPLAKPARLHHFLSSGSHFLGNDFSGLGLAKVGLDESTHSLLASSVPDLPFSADHADSLGFLGLSGDNTAADSAAL